MPTLQLTSVVLEQLTKLESSLAVRDELPHVLLLMI